MAAAPAGRYSRCMSGAEDLEALAERYLELWQRQLALMTEDGAGRARFEAFIAAFAPAAFGTATGGPARAAPDDEPAGAG